MPDSIVLHRISRCLELIYPDARHVLPAAFLRCHSPSADMRTAENVSREQDFSDVSILAVHATGNYAIRLVFSDGHQTGIYSWETLAALSGRFDREQA